MRKYFPLFFGVVLLLAVNSCKKSTETLQTATLNDYYPLEVGKYITYQLDSLVYLSFGTRDTTISYQVKYETDAAITDNLGRPAYRIIRYIRKSDSNPWAPDATFMAVNSNNNFEFVENNLRFIKLNLPIRDANSWKGNSFIDTYSSNSLLQYMDDWDYTYSNVGAADAIGTFSFDNTITVDQRDEIIGNPDDVTSYSEINFAQEKYAKGIGLVYRKFFHSEFQPGNGGYFAEGSYGVTYTIIDHN
ncbi:MAG: hypothetical protein V9E88_06370 [Ferruginibacter sp.]